MTRFPIRVVPRSGPDRVGGVPDGSLLVHVAAAPVDGAANEAVVRLLASTLGVARSSIRLVGGATGRRKVVTVEGLEPEALRRRWPDLGV